MCETYGRDNYSKIKEAFQNKTLEDIREYSQEFWKNWEKIENGQKYVERIEKGESEIERRRGIEMAIEEKFEILREKWQEE